MRLGKMLSVGEVVEQPRVEEPADARPEPARPQTADVTAHDDAQLPDVTHARR
jgi:hypothetical protein